jgi:peptidoglycan/xylan/chitin deacetylase (PgdA/CDA1 family)
LVGTGGIAATLGHFATSVPAAAAERSAREDADDAARIHGSQRILWSAETDERAIALTFDDGPNPLFTPRVLDLLRSRHVVATFFVIGQMLTAHPELGRRLTAEGHEVGNHTWAHQDAALLRGAQVRTDIERGATAVHELLGVRPRWYRPPRGMLTGSAVHYAHGVSEQVAMWSVTRGPPSIAAGDQAGVRAHLVASLAPGAIIDLHDGLGRWNNSPRHGEGPGLVKRRETELAVLPDVIDTALARGYRFVTVSELAAVDHAFVAGD